MELPKNVNVKLVGRVKLVKYHVVMVVVITVTVMSLTFVFVTKTGMVTLVGNQTVTVTIMEAASSLMFVTV